MQASRARVRPAAGSPGAGRLRAGARHDAGDLRRRAAAQRAHPAGDAWAWPGRTSLTEAALYLTTHAGRAVAAAPRAAHPRRHRAARHPEARGVGTASGWRTCWRSPAAWRWSRYGARMALVELQVGRHDHQDAGHAGVVAARAAAGRLHRCSPIEMLFRMRRLLLASAARATTRSRAWLMSWQFAAWLMLGGLDRRCCSSACRWPSRSSRSTSSARSIWLGGEPGLEQLARNSVSLRHQLLAHADPAVHPDGRGAVPYRPRGEGDRRRRAADPRRCPGASRWSRWSPARCSRRSPARPSPPPRCSAA